MPHPARVSLLVLSLAAAGLVAGCSDSDSSPPPPTAPAPAPPVNSKSGTYSTTLAAQPRYTTTLTQTGTSVAWTLQGGQINLTGTGTVNGDVISLTGTSALGTFTSTVTFTTPTTFSGTYSVGGLTGTITGSAAALPSHDLALLGVPRFVTTDYIDLSRISQLSYFRSAAGHDYVDDVETCRSMKHYYVPAAGQTPDMITIRSPVDGVVRGWTQETEGVQVGIESSAHPGVHFILFHVDLTATLPVGTAVSAGQVLGTHGAANGGHSDIAVGVVLPNGSYRLVSYLETLTDGVFAAYQARGVAQRGDLIHTEAARNADPLSCSGETFITTGSLPLYLTLN